MTWQEVDKAIGILVSKIKKSKQEFTAICGIPRGGLIVSVILSNKLNLPLVTYGLTNYNYMNLLISDDISDSGNTLSNFKDYKKVTLFWKKKSKVKPDYYYKIVSERIFIHFPWEK